MFVFRTRVVADLGTQLNFEQLTGVLPGRRYAAPFTALAAAGGVQVTVTVDPLPVTFNVFGSVSYTGAILWQDAVTWAWRQLSPTSIEIAMHNNGAAASTGNVYFSIVGF